MTVKMPGMPRQGARDRSLFLFGLSLVLVVLLCDCAAVASDLDDLNRYVERFNARGYRADYVIAVDVSTSMLDPAGPAQPGLSRFDAIKQALRAFLDQVDAGEYISLVEFGKDADTFFTPRAMPSDAGQRAAFMKEIDGWRIRGGQRSQGTDIGNALQKVLEELNRPGHSDLQIVFFLTDGEQKCPGSVYANPDGQAWKDLSARAASELGDHKLRVYALGFGDQTDVALVGRVFSNTKLAGHDASALGRFFLRNKQEILRAKVAAYIMQELTAAKPEVRGVHDSVIIPRGGSTTIPVTIDPSIPHMDARWDVTDVRRSWQSDIDARSTATGSVSPGSQAVDPRVILSSPRKHSFWKALLRTDGAGVNDSGTLQVTYRIRPQPESLMREMDVPTEVTQTVAVDIRHLTEVERVRPMEWAVVGVLLMILGWTSFRSIAWHRSGRLRGNLMVVTGPRGHESDVWYLDQYGSKAAVGSSGSCEVQLEIDALPVECVLTALRSSFIKAMCSLRTPESIMSVRGDPTTGLVIARYPELQKPAMGATISLNDYDELDFGAWRLRWNP